MNTPQLRVVHWGCGRWGQNVLRALARRQDVRVNCVVDPDPRARAVAKSIVPDALIVHPDNTPPLESFDAAAVATPADAHFAVAMKALRAGLHVFVEKPLALSSQHARILARTASDHRLVGMVGHLLCCHPAVEKTVQVVQDGTIGRLTSLQSERFSLASSREVDGSLLWSLAPHDISVLRCLDQSPVTSVDAHVRWVGLDPGNGRPANVAALRFVTEQGLVTTLSLSRAHQVKTRRMILRGTEGSLVIDDLADDDHKISLVTTNSNAFVRYENKIRPLDRELAIWVDAVTGKKPLDRNGFQDGVQVVRLIERAQESVGISSRSRDREAVTV